MTTPPPIERTPWRRPMPSSDRARARARRSLWAVAAMVFGLLCMASWWASPASAADRNSEGYSGTFSGNKTLWAGTVGAYEDAYITVSGAIASGGSGDWPTVGWVCGSFQGYRDGIGTRSFLISSGTAASASLMHTGTARFCSFTWRDTGTHTVVIDSTSVLLRQVAVPPGPTNPPSASPSVDPSLSPDPSATPDPSASMCPPLPSGVEGPVAPYPYCYPVQSPSMSPSASPCFASPSAGVFGPPAPSTCPNGMTPPSSAPTLAFTMSCHEGDFGGGCAVSTGALAIGAIYSVTFRWDKDNDGAGSWNSDSFHRIMIGSGATECLLTTGSSPNGSATCPSFEVDNTNGVQFDSGGGRAYPAGGWHYADWYLVGGTGFEGETDTDEDGWSDEDEDACGSDPDDPNQDCSNVGDPGGVCYEQHVNGTTGFTYLVEVECGSDEDGDGDGDGEGGGFGPGEGSCSFPDGSLNPLDYFGWIGCNIIALPGRIIDLIRALLTAIVTAVVAMSNAIVDALEAVLAAIVALPGLIVDTIVEVFVPPEGAFDEMLDGISNDLDEKVPFGWVSQINSELDAATSYGVTSGPPTPGGMTLGAGAYTAEVDINTTWFVAAQAIAPYRTMMIGAIWLFALIAVSRRVRSVIAGGG